jgi:hypothetical protein
MISSLFRGWSYEHRVGRGASLVLVQQKIWVTLREGVSRSGGSYVYMISVWCEKARVEGGDDGFVGQRDHVRVVCMGGSHPSLRAF